MLAGAREFFNSKKGRNVAIGLAIVGIAVAIYSIASNWGSAAASMSSKRVYMCSETAKSFTLKVEADTKIPVLSPYSNKTTGYLAEFCYWNKEGKLKQDPTYVLLNEYAGKKGATFCPDCGRLVVSQNPIGIPGDPPPPTQANFKPMPGQ